MQTKKLWNNEIEKQFFNYFLKKENYQPEKLFYLLNKKYLAYIPKNIKSSGYTLQSRNSLVGQFTEKWCQQLLSPIARKFNLYAVPNVICEQAGLYFSVDLFFWNDCQK